MSGAKKKKKKADGVHQGISRFELSVARFHKRLFTHLTSCDPSLEFPQAQLPPGVTRHLCGKTSNVIFVQGPAGCGKTSVITHFVKEVCKDRSKEQDFVFHVSLRELSEAFRADDKLDIVDLFAFIDSEFYNHDRDDVLQNFALLQARIVIILDDAHDFRYPLNDEIPVMDNKTDKAPINVLLQNLIRGDIYQDMLKVMITERLHPCYKKYEDRVEHMAHHFNLDEFLDKFAGNHAKLIRELIDNCHAFQHLRSSPVTAIDFVAELMTQFGKGDNYRRAIKKERNVLLKRHHVPVGKSDAAAFLDFFTRAGDYLLREKEREKEANTVQVVYKMVHIS